MTNRVDITVAVTAHHEGILIHHTLMSIFGAIKQLPQHIRCEIIVHADNPNTSTIKYLDRSKQFVPDKIAIRTFTNTFGDPGTSRNFCAKNANGRYIAYIDADDLMCDNWLVDAYTALESNTNPCVAHSEYTIEFGDLDSIVKKYPAIDKATDSLLSVWAGRWNAIIFAPTDIVNKVGYPQAKDGYGFEDWEMSCKLISADVNNVTIPKTVMFVRRKSIDSVWNQHRSQRTVLRKNSCLSFDYIRSIEVPQNFINYSTSSKILPASIEKYRHSQTLPVKILKKARRIAKRMGTNASIPQINTLPDWILKHWHIAHSYDRSIFPHENLINTPSVYHSLTEDHYKVGYAYKQIVNQTKHNSYDYVIFVPWIISGGADLYTINIANELAQISPNKRVAIVATTPSFQPSLRPLLLNDKVDLISFAPYINNLDVAHIDRLIEQFIENSGASILHIINSLQAYDFLETHNKYISLTSKKVIVTSFSQSIDPKTGRFYGYSHTHVPKVYDSTSLVTTDNHAVANMWVKDYGFDINKIKVIRPVVRSTNKIYQHTTTPYSGPNKVLWAARLAPEKLVELVPKIANYLPSSITIDMYGTPGDDFDKSLLNKLPVNVSYKGPFDNFYSLPLESYSAFLYTSLFDGMPNALVEATTAGLPIIASASGGIGEFITKDTGILIEDIYNAKLYADGIVKIINDPALSANYVNEASRLIAQEYSGVNFNKNIVDLIKIIGY